MTIDEQIAFVEREIMRVCREYPEPNGFGSWLLDHLRAILETLKAVKSRNASFPDVFVG